MTRLLDCVDISSHARSLCLHENLPPLRLRGMLRRQGEVAYSPSPRIGVRGMPLTAGMTEFGGRPPLHAGTCAKSNGWLGDY